MLELIYSFDKTVMEFVQQNLHNPFTDGIFPYITYLGEYGFVWIIACVALLFTKKYRKWGIVAAAALAITFITGDVVLKNLFERQRPFQDFPEAVLFIYPPSSFSFPSGHSSSAFSVATVLLFANKKLGTFAVILAGLIAFSRVFLFVHYPSDILFGAALGAAFGISASLLFKYYEKKYA